MKYFHPKKYWRLIKEWIHDIFLYYIISDSLYLKIRYKEVFGKKLNFSNPKTFTEKIQWLKLHDRNPLYHQLVDKCDVKSIIANIIGDEYIIKTLGVWERFEDIDFDKLPNQFVLKCTHDSASIVICKDKSQFDPLKYKRMYNDIFLKTDYYHYQNKQYHQDCCDTELKIPL